MTVIQLQDTQQDNTLDACHVKAKCTVADMTLGEAAHQMIAPSTIVKQEHWQLVKSCHPLAPHLEPKLQLQRSNQLTGLNRVTGLQVVHAAPQGGLADTSFAPFNCVSWGSMQCSTTTS